MPNWIQNLARHFFVKQAPNPDQEKIFAACREGMRRMESIYAVHLQQLNLVLQPAGLFRARLFGAFFPLHAYAASSRAHRGSANELYFRLLPEAGRGFRASSKKKKQLAHMLLQEQFRALGAESQNVGAGQYALGILYLQALEASCGGSPMKNPMPLPVDTDALLGKLIGENLAVWARWYETCAKRPMQSYTQGFQRSGQDLDPLRGKD